MIARRSARCDDSCCWPWSAWPRSSSTARSAWGTASRRPRCSWRPGIAPAAASAAIHFSELGTSLVSGFSHHTLGNTDWRTVGVLAAPGFVGAFAGATLLVNLDADVAVPVVAVLLIALGIFVTFRFLTPRRLTFGPRPGARFLAPLGLFAGALDAVGGGGWGPVGTSSLLASGRLEPRKVVGSVDTAEFVVAVGGSLGFLVGLGAQGIEWAYVLALMVGGVVAAPIAAVLVRYLPARVLGVAAGGLIVLTNLQTLADGRTPPASPRGCSPRWSSPSGCCGPRGRSSSTSLSTRPIRGVATPVGA